MAERLGILGARKAMENDVSPPLSKTKMNSQIKQVQDRLDDIKKRLKYLSFTSADPNDNSVDP